jgi:hypothetical protein
MPLYLYQITSKQSEICFLNKRYPSITLQSFVYKSSKIQDKAVPEKIVYLLAEC